MSYKIYLDDIRDPPPNSDNWVICRTSDEAINCLKNKGIPTFISFDHDLGMVDGKEDTAMIFLRRWLSEIWDGYTTPPRYAIHSENPVGRKNIDSYMKTWIKICESCP